MKTLCSKIEGKRLPPTKFFTENITIKLPVGNSHYCGGILKRAVRDISGEFIGCVGIEVVRLADL